MRLIERTLVFCVFAAGGCLSPSGPVDIRYYSIEPLRAEDLDTQPSARLKLRRVEGASHLQERIVWRQSDVKLGFHELDRWTEPPVVYLREMLEAQLFPARFVRSEAPAAPALDVELRAFEVARSPGRGVRVVLSLVLTDTAGDALIDRVLEIRREPQGPTLDAAARALRAALQDAVQQAAQLLEQHVP